MPPVITVRNEASKKEVDEEEEELMGEMKSNDDEISNILDESMVGDIDNTFD